MMDPDDPRTLSEKRSDAARSKAALQAHPLFLYEPGEKIHAIAWINVRRYGVNGMTESNRVWPAGELSGEDDIYTFFGGGAYELLGRGALPDGRPGLTVKKRTLKLEGEPKPFAGEHPVAHAGAVPAAAPAHSPVDMFLAMMAEDRREARAREERRDAEARLAEERRSAREEATRAQSTQLLVQGLGIVAGIVTTIVSRPTAPAPDIAGTFTAGMNAMLQILPKPDAGDPLDKLGKVLDLAKKMTPETPEKSESLPELMQGFGEMMGGLAQVEHARVEAAKNGLLSPPVPGAQVNGNAHPTQPAPPPQMQPSEEAAGLTS